VPRLVVRWEVPVAADLGDTTKLVGAQIELRVSRERASGNAPAFLGHVARVSTGIFGPTTHALTVEALAMPAAAIRHHRARPTFRTWAAGDGLADVVKGLLEDAGWDGASPRCPGEKLPAQLVGGGRPAWTLLHEVLAVHGLALVVRPGAAVNDKIVVVATGSDLAKTGEKVSLSFGRASESDKAVVTFLEVIEQPKGSAFSGAWMDVTSEKGWQDGSAEAAGDRALVAGLPAPNEATAKAYAKGATATGKGPEVRVSLRLNDLAVRVGDTISIQDVPLCAGVVQSHGVDAPPVVTAVRCSASQGSGAARLDVSVEAMPEGGTVRQTAIGDDGAVILLSGVVTETPPGQGQMKVKLDVPGNVAGKGTVLCEWVSPWLSGELGGLHAPPLVGDRVILLAERRPYGRIVYGGAHPGDDRLGKMRKSFMDETQVDVARNRSGALEKPAALKSDHLGRAWAAGGHNVLALLAPKVGLGEGADGLESVAWLRVQSGDARATTALLPGRVLAESAGSDAILAARSDKLLAAEAGDTASAYAEKSAQHTAGKVDVLSKASIGVESKDSSSWTAGQSFIVDAGASLSATAKRAASLTSSDSNVSVKAATECSIEAKALSMSSKEHTEMRAGKDLRMSADAKMAHNAKEVIVDGTDKCSVSTKKLAMQGSDDAHLSGGKINVKADGKTTIGGSAVHVK